MSLWMTLKDRGTGQGIYIAQIRPLKIVVSYMLGKYSVHCIRMVKYTEINFRRKTLHRFILPLKYTHAFFFQFKIFYYMNSINEKVILAEK